VKSCKFDGPHIKHFFYDQSSQRRIQFDEFSRSVKSQRNNSDYQGALDQIVRNSSSRSLNKRLQAEQREREIERALKLSQEAERKKLDEIKIQQEMKRHEDVMRRNCYHEQKMRQQIRENNQELRELESKLRQAYVLKGLYVQKKEKEALLLAEKIEEKKENDLKEKERLAYLDEIKKNDQIMAEKKKKLREELMSQIISAHQKRTILFEEFLKEKAYLDEIARRVKQELIEEATKRVQARERTLKEMEWLKTTRQELERLQSIEIEEENRRIVEYCQQRDKKIEEDEKRQRELEQKRDSLNEKMVKELSELMVWNTRLWFYSYLSHYFLIAILEEI
jgi:Trichohyalin-plectin-homology domain